MRRQETELHAQPLTLQQENARLNELMNQMRSGQRIYGH